MELYNIVEQQRNNMNISDALKMYYLSDSDMEVCSYVSSKLPYINFDSIVSGNKISLDLLMEFSVNEMSVFGKDIYLILSDLISDISVRCDTTRIDDFTTFVGYDVLADGNVIQDSGKAYEYVIPSQLYELSIYLLCHEHVHSLKDTNYTEYQSGMILGEVLPIFYELLIYTPRDILKKELIKIRMNNMIRAKKEYLEFDFYARRSSKYDNMFESKCGIVSDETKIYEFVRSRLGCYLNSFYYAVILYKMYKETPKKILDLVTKVLKHEMTTLQMLESLGLYGDIRGEIFEKEMKNIRRFIK